VAAAGEGKQEPSFSEEKEAKRLFPFCTRGHHLHRRGRNGTKRGKVFWFFFSK
jgi:hypothetical protein